ncbi:C-type lectin domain family 4 member E-like [Trachinotus anak]|uniref:C-type lectin domain family 4 member E-like n=1 Tax=Trachinotus anak TaxID=443729 RepID=UPI0039F222ED
MEEIYCNVQQVKPVDSKPSTNQTGPSSSERFHGAVVLCLGLLSVFLLAGLIGLGARYHDSVSDSAAEVSALKANLTERLQASDEKLSSLTEERELLIASLTEVTEELNRLQRWSKHKKTCPTGWRMFSCTCYLLSTESGSWEKGREDCGDRGADLVVIDSHEEQEFLIKTINQEAWIGLTDREKKNTWKWIDGAPLTLMYWQKGQPDKGNGNPKWGEEDCAVIQPGMKHEENWNDLRCDASRQWICEEMP